MFPLTRHRPFLRFRAPESDRQTWTPVSIRRQSVLSLARGNTDEAERLIVRLDFARWLVRNGLVSDAPGGRDGGRGGS